MTGSNGEQIALVDLECTEDKHEKYNHEYEKPRGILGRCGNIYKGSHLVSGIKKDSSEKVTLELR